MSLSIAQIDVEISPISRLSSCMHAYDQRSLENIDNAISDCKIASTNGNADAVVYLLRAYYFNGKYATAQAFVYLESYKCLLCKYLQN